MNNLKTQSCHKCKSANTCENQCGKHYNNDDSFDYDQGFNLDEVYD